MPVSEKRQPYAQTSVMNSFWYPMWVILIAFLIMTKEVANYHSYLMIWNFHQFGLFVPFEFITVKEILFIPPTWRMGFPGNSAGKESAVQKTPVWFLGWEDPLERGMATNSSILAWRIPWTVQSWGRKESDTNEWLSLSYEGYSNRFC